MWKGKHGMLVAAISFAIVLRAIGKFVIDLAVARRTRKAPRKKR
ncbi:hypothetical protein [Lactovum odontotermitis]